METLIKVSEFLNDIVITEKIINCPNTSLDTIQNLPIFEDNLTIMSENCLFIYQIKEVIKKGYVYNTTIQEKCLLYKFELIPITHEFSKINSKEIETQTDSILHLPIEVDHFAKFLDTTFNQINDECEKFYSEQQHENAERIYYPIQSENCCECCENCDCDRPLLENCCECCEDCQCEDCQCENCDCNCECHPLISKFEEINLNEGSCKVPSWDTPQQGNTSVASLSFDALRQQTLPNTNSINVASGNLISELKIRLDKPNHGLNYTGNYFNYTTI